MDAPIRNFISVSKNQQLMGKPNFESSKRASNLSKNIYVTLSLGLFGVVFHGKGKKALKKWSSWFNLHFRSSMHSICLLGT